MRKIKQKINDFTKRAFDIGASLIGLIALSPVMFFTAILIKLNSPGSVFYRGARIGRHRRPFKIFKFRTMVMNAENLGGSSTAHDDPRLTKIGKFLRKYKIDELPQLMNVLRGEMSIVGPRPQVEKYIGLYNEEEKIILTVRPGLTDYASIEFINLDKILGNERVDEKYLKEIEPRKNILRMEYIKKHSLWVDCKILFQTFVQFFKIKSLWNIRN